MLNIQKTLDAARRIVALHHLAAHRRKSDLSRDMDQRMSARGWTFRPNVHASWSVSRIHSQNDIDARENQTRRDLTIGLGVVGSYPNVFQRRLRRRPVPVQPLPSPVIEEETEPVRPRTDVIIIEEEDIVPSR